MQLPESALAYQRIGFMNALIHYASPTSLSRLFANDLGRCFGSLPLSHFSPPHGYMLHTPACYSSSPMTRVGA